MTTVAGSLVTDLAGAGAAFITNELPTVPSKLSPLITFALTYLTLPNPEAA